MTWNKNEPWRHCCSVAQLCLTLCDPIDCSTPGLSDPHQLLELAQVHFHCIGDAIHPSHSLTPSSPSALNLSKHQGLFQWVVCLHPMTKYWSFSISSSSKYSGFTSLKMDWFDLLAVQGTFRSLFQHHSSKASILWCSTFFKVLLSQSCVTTGKNIALAIWTFVGRAISLFFNTVSRFVNYILQ